MKGLFGMIQESAEKGATVYVRGFGNWSYSERKGRRGRNPRTGEDVPIHSARKFVFKASRATRKETDEQWPNSLEGKEPPNPGGSFLVCCGGIRRPKAPWYRRPAPNHRQG